MCFDLIIKARLEDNASNLAFFNNGESSNSTTKSSKGVKCICSADPLTAFLADFQVIDKP